MMILLAFLAALQGLPAPDASLRKQGEADLRGQFKVEYSRRLPGDVRALASRLLEGALSGEFREVGMRYTAFCEARNLYLTVGDVYAAFTSIDKMASVFLVDGVSEKTAFLSRASAGATGDVLSCVANLYFQVASEAAALDRFEEAQKLFSASESSASLCKDFQLRDSATRYRTFFEPFKTALRKSKKGGVELGRWLCFFKGDWAAGLPLLAAGKDRVAEAAKLELAGLSSVEESVKVADSWWEAVSREKPGPLRDSAWDHSVGIFSKLSGVGPEWDARFTERRRTIERERLGDKVECVPGMKLRTRGIKLMPEIGDGRCEIGFFKGRPSLRTGAQDTGPCAYFNVSDTWLEAGTILEISVDYFDAGVIMTLGASTVKGATLPDGVRMGTSAVWKTYVAKVPADALVNGLHGADFRMVLSGGEGYIGRVSLRKLPK